MNNLLNNNTIKSYLILPKVQNEGNIHKNLNNCHNCFLMLCSYENSCFCLVVIKMSVKVLVIN